MLTGPWIQPCCPHRDPSRCLRTRPWCRRENRRPLTLEVLNDNPWPRARRVQTSKRVVSGHENSKRIRCCCTPLAVFQQRRVTAMPSDVLCLERQVAGGDWSRGLACVHCCCSGSTVQRARGPVPAGLAVSIQCPCLPHWHGVGGISPVSMLHARCPCPWPCLCSLSARNGLSTTGLSARSRLGAQAGPPPCPPARTLPPSPK
jgi:hypothetical protein